MKKKAVSFNDEKKIQSIPHENKGFKVKQQKSHISKANPEQKAMLKFHHKINDIWLEQFNKIFKQLKGEDQFAMICKDIYRTTKHVEEETQESHNNYIRAKHLLKMLKKPHKYYYCTSIDDFLFILQNKQINLLINDEDVSIKGLTKTDIHNAGFDSIIEFLACYKEVYKPSLDRVKDVIGSDFSDQEAQSTFKLMANFNEKKQLCNYLHDWYILEKILITKFRFTHDKTFQKHFCKENNMSLETLKTDGECFIKCFDEQLKSKALFKSEKLKEFLNKVSLKFKEFYFVGNESSELNEFVKQSIIPGKSQFMDIVAVVEARQAHFSKTLSRAEKDLEKCCVEFIDPQAAKKEKALSKFEQMKKSQQSANNTISQMKSDESFKSENEGVYGFVHDRDRILPEHKKEYGGEGSFKNGNWYNPTSSLTNITSYPNSSNKNRDGYGNMPMGS